MSKTMTKLKTTKFDITQYLTDDEAIAEYLSDALETNDLAYISHAIGEVARAKGMTNIAKKSGVKREALYRSLSENGKPQFSTILAVLSALDIKLTAATV